MKKRILSVLLALALCLTLLPTVAFADDEGGAAPATPATRTDGHIDDNNDNKCDTCGIGLWLTWAAEDHTAIKGEGTWTFSEDGTLTILGTGSIEIYQRSDETPWFECLASVKKLVIGAGITSAGSSSFSNSTNLAEVVLPDTLTEIGTYAFGSCHALTTFRIPKGVKTIEEGAFSDCIGLEAFEVADGNTYFFTEDGVLFRKNFEFSTTTDPETGYTTSEETTTPTGTSTLVTYPANKAGTSYAIPAGVSTILHEAFRAADRLTVLSLPASLTSISTEVLFGFLNLTTITVDASNTAYKSIDGVLFSKDGTTLLYYPLAKADSSYTIPSGVKVIGAYAIMGVEALTSVTIPEGVTAIKRGAFSTCFALREVNIPASVTSIEPEAFVACTSLTAIHVAAESTAYKDIDGVLFSADGKTLLCCPIAKTGSYTVPAGVETIDEYAFSQSKLTSVSLPEGVKTIGGYAFLGAEKLVSVSLPASVTDIYPWVFSACYSLRNVYFAGSESAWNNMNIQNRDGWFTEEDTTNTCLDIKDVTTVHYEFDGKLTVTLDVNGGTLADSTQESWTVPYNTVSDYTPPMPTRSGYYFAGWSYSADVYHDSTQTVSTTSRIWNWGDPVYQDMTLTATWSLPPTYPVTLPETAKNGAAEFSPRRAEKGETVTVTLTPNEGYEPGSLTVTDKDGNVLELTEAGDGKYTFQMPAGEVTVNVNFVPKRAPFEDVPADANYAAAVNWAFAQGITGGVDDTHFAPNSACTRAQIVTFLYRWAVANGVDVSVGEDTNILSYSDALSVPERAVPAFQWAVGAGILRGNGGSLMPNQTCTRAQAVAFLFRFAQTTGMDAVTLQELVSGFGDVSQVPSYALPAFNWALATGVVLGHNGNLMPENDCTRAHIVMMLYRLLGD